MESNRFRLLGKTEKDDWKSKINNFFIVNNYFMYKMFIDFAFIVLFSRGKSLEKISYMSTKNQKKIKKSKKNQKIKKKSKNQEKIKKSKKNQKI